jgi:hypothetical protein
MPKCPRSVLRSQERAQKQVLGRDSIPATPRQAVARRGADPRARTAWVCTHQCHPGLQHDTRIEGQSVFLENSPPTFRKPSRPRGSGHHGRAFVGDWRGSHEEPLRVVYYDIKAWTNLKDHFKPNQLAPVISTPASCGGYVESATLGNHDDDRLQGRVCLLSARQD